MSDLVKDNSFDLEKTYDYILSIQVSLDGFSFSVIHPAEKKIIAFKRTPLKISNESLISRRFKEWIESDELIQKAYKKVRVIVYSDNYSLIPDVFYNEQIKDEIPEYLFEKKESLEIAENVIGKIKAKLIFPMPVGLNEVIRNSIGECEIAHPVKIIINSISSFEKENTLVLLFNAKKVYATLINQQTVVLSNSFIVVNASDVLYHALNMLQQLKIDPAKTEILLADSISETKDIKDSLQPYFNNVNYLQADSLITNPEMISNSFHSYFSLI